MKKIKKYIIYILFFIAFILINNKVQASSNELYLYNLDFQAQINSDGSMDLTEIWNINIENTNTLYKIFKIDKTKYSNITDVKVTDITDGNSQTFIQTNQWQYHLPQGTYFAGINEDGLFEISFGTGLEHSYGTKQYAISYHVEDVITKYNDYAELYWQFLGEDFSIPAKIVTATITLPSNSDDINDIRVWGHTEDLNGEIYAVNTNTIEMKINNYTADKFIEIRTLFPSEMIYYSNKEVDKDILDEVVKQETIWAEEANKRRQMKEQSIFIISNVISIAIAIFTIRPLLKNIRKIRERKELKPSQEIIYYREIPREDASPGEALQLYCQNKKVDSETGKIFSATLLDLSLKNIIEIKQEGKEICITILKKQPEELENNKDEKIIFEFLKEACEDNNSITVKELEQYIKKHPVGIMNLESRLHEYIEKKLNKNQLINKSAREERMKINTHIGIYVFFLMIITFLLMITMIGISLVSSIGILLCFIIVIAQIVALNKLQHKISILTQEGIDENEKWKGLIKYMEDFSMIEQKEVPEITIWEKFLVYATVFGIADKVIKQLKIVYPNLSETINTNNYVYLMVNTDFSSNFSHSISSSISKTYSSASGGGGGFSGGGRRSVAGRRTVGGGR